MRKWERLSQPPSILTQYFVKLLYFRMTVSKRYFKKIKPTNSKSSGFFLLLDIFRVHFVDDALENDIRFALVAVRAQVVQHHSTVFEALKVHKYLEKYTRFMKFSSFPRTYLHKSRKLLTILEASSSNPLNMRSSIDFTISLHFASSTGWKTAFSKKKSTFSNVHKIWCWKITNGEVFFFLQNYTHTTLTTLVTERLLALFCFFRSDIVETSDEVKAENIENHFWSILLVSSKLVLIEKFKMQKRQIVVR